MTVPNKLDPFGAEPKDSHRNLRNPGKQRIREISLSPATCYIKKTLYQNVPTGFEFKEAACDNSERLMLMKENFYYGEWMINTEFRMIQLEGGISSPVQTRQLLSLHDSFSTVPRSIPNHSHEL